MKTTSQPYLEAQKAVIFEDKSAQQHSYLINIICRVKYLSKIIDDVKNCVIVVATGSG